MKLALRFQKAVAVAMEGNSAFKKARRKKKKQNWRPPFKNVIPKLQRMNHWCRFLCCAAP